MMERESDKEPSVAPLIAGPPRGGRAPGPCFCWGFHTIDCDTSRFPGVHDPEPDERQTLHKRTNGGCREAVGPEPRRETVGGASMAGDPSDTLPLLGENNRTLLGDQRGLVCSPV